MTNKKNANGQFMTSLPCRTIQCFDQQLNIRTRRAPTKTVYYLAVDFHRDHVMQVWSAIDVVSSKKTPLCHKPRPRILEHLPVVIPHGNELSVAAPRHFAPPARRVIGVGGDDYRANVDAVVFLRMSQRIYINVLSLPL